MGHNSRIVCYQLLLPHLHQRRLCSFLGLLQSGNVIVHVLLISITKIMKFIQRVITLIIITVIRHGVGHI